MKDHSEITSNWPSPIKILWEKNLDNESCSWLEREQKKSFLAGTIKNINTFEKVKSVNCDKP